MTDLQNLDGFAAALSRVFPPLPAVDEATTSARLLPLRLTADQPASCCCGNPVTTSELHAYGRCVECWAIGSHDPCAGRPIEPELATRPIMEDLPVDARSVLTRACGLP